MSLLKEIGAILGFVAFGGLAVLAFLTFQQARHLRRLRDWAGRAPERAAAHEARRETTAGGLPLRSGSTAAVPGRLDQLRGEVAARYKGIDRRMPFDLRLLAAALLAVIVGVGIATSGFGLLGGGDAAVEPGDGGAKAPSSKEVEVAVLNGTAPGEGAVGVVGIARRVSKDVESAGYRVGDVDTAGPYAASVVMYEDGAKSDAKKLAGDLEGELGQTDVRAITPDIQSLAGGAPLALVIGQDDGGI